MNEPTQADGVIAPGEVTPRPPSVVRSRVFRTPLRVRLRDLFQRYALVFVWLLMAGVFSILRPATFFSKANFQTVFGSQSVLVVLTLALLITLTVGEFDLSVSATLGLSATLVAVLNVDYGMPVGLAILVALAAGALVGGVNGFVVVRIGVDAFIATLGVGTLLVGVALLISHSLTISGVSYSLQNATNYRVGGLPLSFFYCIVMAAVLWYVLRHLPVGRHLLFIGQNREVARLAGVAVDRLRWTAFVASGLVSAVAGVILVGTLGGFLASVSTTFLLPAFAAAFLGSAVVDPGRFNAWGSVIAIYFLITGIVGLELLGFSGWIEQVFYGGALVVAITVSTLARKRVVA